MQQVDYTNLGLRNKTFLDFTDDKAIIEEVVGDRNLFLQFLDETTKIMSYLDFSEITSDKRLAKAIQKEFQKEYIEHKSFIFDE